MRPPRTVPLTLVAALLTLAIPTAAATAKTPKERKLDASFQTTLTPPTGEQVQTTRMMTMWVPKGVRAAGEKMPTCDPVQMEARGAQVCKRLSQVGKGTAKGWVFDTVEPMTITLYNGPGNTLLARVVGLSPVSLDVVVRGKITKPKGGRYGYGQKLEFPFPDSLIYPVPGATASMIYMSARLDSKAGWLRSTSCTPEGWSLGALLEGVDGSMTSMKADIACVGAES